MKLGRKRSVEIDKSRSEEVLQIYVQSKWHHRQTYCYLLFVSRDHMPYAMVTSDLTGAGSEVPKFLVEDENEYFRDSQPYLSTVSTF
jgi:hypothetical protein